MFSFSSAAGGGINMLPGSPLIECSHCLRTFKLRVAEPVLCTEKRGSGKLASPSLARPKPPRKKDQPAKAALKQAAGKRLKAQRERAKAGRQRAQGSRQRVQAGKAPAAARPPLSAARRKNPRLLAALLNQRLSAVERYFETAPPEEVLPFFEESYCSSLVNMLLDLKKSTAKRLFEIAVQHRKRAFINVFTLYYHKEYLTNPLPLTLESDAGRNLPNHYAILGVPREATVEELKLAHKLLVGAYSPESFPPAERRMGEERLQEINFAFEILKNPQRRKVLDETLPNISYLYPRRDQCWLNAVTKLVS
jgi:hypothetical protein